MGTGESGKSCSSDRASIAIRTLFDGHPSSNVRWKRLWLRGWPCGLRLSLGIGHQVARVEWVPRSWSAELRRARATSYGLVKWCHSLKECHHASPMGEDCVAKQRWGPSSVDFGEVNTLAHIRMGQKQISPKIKWWKRSYPLFLCENSTIIEKTVRVVSKLDGYQWCYVHRRANKQLIPLLAFNPECVFTTFDSYFPNDILCILGLILIKDLS